MYVPLEPLTRDSIGFFSAGAITLYSNEVKKSLQAWIWAMNGTSRVGKRVSGKFVPCILSSMNSWYDSTFFGGIFMSPFPPRTRRRHNLSKTSELNVSGDSKIFRCYNVLWLVRTRFQVVAKRAGPQGSGPVCNGLALHRIAVVSVREVN